MAKIVGPAEKEKLKESKNAAPKIKDVVDKSASEEFLKKTTIRLHPDVKDAIEARANEERRNITEVLREIILLGMRAKGIEIGKDAEVLN